MKVIKKILSKFLRYDFIKRIAKRIFIRFRNLKWIHLIRLWIFERYSQNFRILFSVVLLLFFWSWIFGLVIGIFGVNLDIVRIADFYLNEGTKQNINTHTFRVISTGNKILNNDSVNDLQNIESVGFVDPYFTPNTEVIGSIEYFGFSTSNIVKLVGIPNRIGMQKANKLFQYAWERSEMSDLPILIPENALTLYNSVAPKQGWPSLTKNSFLGFPGFQLKINGESFQAILSGFDSEEFGTVVFTSAEKLLTIYENQNYKPTYSYILIETMPDQNRSHIKMMLKEIKKLGFTVSKNSEDSLQQNILIRVKYLSILIGFSILISFMFLYSRSILNCLTPLKKTIFLYRIWGQEHAIGKIICILSGIFSLITGFFSWGLCFFITIPAKKYFAETLSQIGISIPPLKDSAKTSLEIGALGIFFFVTLTIITLFQFYLSIPRLSKEKNV